MGGNADMSAGTSAFLIAFLCTVGLSVAAYYLIQVQNRTLYLIGFVGIFLMILSMVLDILEIGKIPNTSFLSLVLLTGLGASGWGIGGAMREWFRKQYVGSE